MSDSEVVVKVDGSIYSETNDSELPFLVLRVYEWTWSRCDKQTHSRLEWDRFLFLSSYRWHYESLYLLLYDNKCVLCVTIYIVTFQRTLWLSKSLPKNKINPILKDVTFSFNLCNDFVLFNSGEIVYVKTMKRKERKVT